MLDENSWRKYRTTDRKKPSTRVYSQTPPQELGISRRRYRNRYFIVLALSIAVLLFSLHRVMTHRDWYLLQHIRITGTHYLSPDDVLAVLDLNVGLDNLHDISEEALVRKLKRSLIYVSDAEVSKSLMEGVLTVRVTERTPSTLMIYRDKSNQDRFFLTDLEGAVLQEVFDPELLTESLLVIEIASETPPEVGTYLTSEASVHGLEVARMIRERVPDLEVRLTRIHPDDSNKIQLELKDSAPGWLAAERIEDGLRNLNTVLGNPSIDLGSVAYIDARFHGMIYCGG